MNKTKKLELKQSTLQLLNRNTQSQSIHHHRAGRRCRSMMKLAEKTDQSKVLN